MWSKHVDIQPGDRAATCRGLMRPERIEQRRGKGLVVIHRCVACGFARPNRIADDPVQGDDINAVYDTPDPPVGADFPVPPPSVPRAPH
jgi:hypothetical protein